MINSNLPYGSSPVYNESTLNYEQILESLKPEVFELESDYLKDYANLSHKHFLVKLSRASTSIFSYIFG